eukprot:1240567-Lingulodinium_polyedra.AAC.1
MAPTMVWCCSGAVWVLVWWFGAVEILKCCLGAAWQLLGNCLGTAWELLRRCLGAAWAPLNAAQTTLNRRV